MNLFLDFQSPQLFLHVSAFFILALNFLYFSSLNFMQCKYTYFAILLFFAMVLLFSLFLISNVSQLLINQVNIFEWKGWSFNKIDFDQVTFENWLLDLSGKSTSKVLSVKHVLLIKCILPGFNIVELNALTLSQRKWIVIWLKRHVRLLTVHLKDI